MYTDAPVDSTEARERREAEAEDQAAAELDRRRHAETCMNGWVGEDQDGRPAPCPRCRPHLLTVACWTCGQTSNACRIKWAALTGRCCDYCDHSKSRLPTTVAQRLRPLETRP